MQKKYKYIVILIVILITFSLIKIITYKKNESSKVKNIGTTLSERIYNLHDIVNKDSGLYKVNNKYIFKGNPNNYIIFNEELWRIVSLEEDGTIKIVRNELLNIEKDYENAIGYLNTKYYNSIKNKEYIIEHDYDITYYDIGKLTSEETLYNQKSIQKEKYKVGMLNVIEVANATTYVTLDEYLNIFFWVNRKTNYLYLNEKWLTMTPNVYIEYDFLKEKENINSFIRPVVYLNKELKIASGLGTKSSPYIIE